MTAADAAVALDALANLIVVLEKYSQRSVDAVEHAGRALNDVARRVDAELQVRLQERDAAERSLQACKARRRGPCDAEAERLRRACDRVERAEAARQRIAVAASRFLPAQRRFSDVVVTVVPRSQVSLAARSRAIEDYARGTGAAVSSAASVTAAAAAPVVSGVVVPAGVPDGYALVPVSLIDDGDSPVRDEADFNKGYSAADLGWALDAFDEVVLPAIARGLGMEYLRERDGREGRQGCRSYADTMSGFLRDADAITLEVRPDGRYAIANGYHRIWVARSAGRSHVPARLS